MGDGRYCDVAVAVPVFGTFTYKVPPEMESELRMGHRVLVPFGNRRLTGYVLDPDIEPSIDEGVLIKPVFDLLDPEPAFDPQRLALFRFIADYYQCPLGEAIRMALPTGINRESKIQWSLTEQGIEGRNEPGLRINDRRILLCMEPGKSYTTRQLHSRCEVAGASTLLRLTDLGFVHRQDTLENAKTKSRLQAYYFVHPQIDIDAANKSLGRARKQLAIFNFLIESCGADGQTIASMLGQSPTALSALVDRGLVIKEMRECYRDPDCTIALCEATDFDLNRQQQAAFDTVAGAMDSGKFSPFLLHGITGSGKTEVYLRLAQRVLDAGKTVLVMVPEIALTPQLLSRFARRFGSDVAVSHSGLSDPERYDEFRRMLRGEARLCVGTRSAVFAPLANLGLIVVDEEHDTSYKQDDSIPYNGRDLALLLGKNTGAAVVLGSATPSLESYTAAKQGRYRLIEITERATAGQLPKVTVIDLVEELAAARRRHKTEEPDPTHPKSLPSADASISRSLATALQETLDEGEQAILFLNRRGYSTHAFCLECRRTIMCPNCDVSLTGHFDGKVLRCHYCDHTRSAATICDHCGGRQIFLAGMGTEQVEKVLAQKFVDARIARLDRDTTVRRGSLQRTLEDFAARKYDILVGTQMVTKGHDFPGVTLVGVISADSSMNLPDFRAAERTFQLLAQVSGRAGRGDRAGRVIVQTFNPDHYAITTAQEHDYRAFYEIESERRRMPTYPPYNRLALMRARSESVEKVRSFILMVAGGLRQTANDLRVDGVNILGPSPSALSKIKGKYRFQLLIKAPTPSLLLQMAARARSLSDQWNHPGVEWRIDIDPQNVL